jgi:hypothetical protein
MPRQSKRKAKDRDLERNLLGIADADLEREWRAMSSEQRELERLKGYLEYTLWDAHRAAYIIAGIDPEQTMGGPGDWGIVWLPGGLRENWHKADGSIDRLILEQHVSMEVEYVSGFIQGESRRPIEWIEKAKSKGYEIPWLAAVQGVGLLQDVTETASVQRKGGIATRDATPQFQAKCELLERWDQRKEALGDIDVQGFAREMVSRFATKAEERTIKGWVGELSRPQVTSLIPPWADELRQRRHSAMTQVLETWDGRSSRFGDDDVPTFRAEMVRKFSTPGSVYASKGLVETWVSDLMREKQGGATSPWIAEIRRRT